MTASHRVPAPPVKAAILSLLRGEVPAADAPADEADEALRRYECGGYLHDAWTRSGRAGGLPPGWAAALERRHRKTAIDNLAALAAFRKVGGVLRDDGVPFVLLKGAAYLDDLYDDPAARALTDIDLLIRRADAARVARRLRAGGFDVEVGRDYPENERFEAWEPGASNCRFEFHWRLGLPNRFAVDTEALWARSRSGALEGIACRRPAPEDALAYHVAHLADHYFGPHLKWIIDLREMLRRWRVPGASIVERAVAWRLRAAHWLAFEHLVRLFPDEGRPDAGTRLRPGPARRAWLSRYLSADPLELLAVPDRGPARALLRCLMIDRPADACALGARVMLRPALGPLGRLTGRARPPWEWRD